MIHQRKEVSSEKAFHNDITSRAVQDLQLSEVAQLRWDGTGELIPVELPEITRNCKEENA